MGDVILVQDVVFSCSSLVYAVECPMVGSALWMLSVEVYLEDNGQAAVIVIVKEHCVAVRPASHSEVTGAWLSELGAACLPRRLQLTSTVVADLEQELPLAENLNPCMDQATQDVASKR